MPELSSAAADSPIITGAAISTRTICRRSTGCAHYCTVFSTSNSMSPFIACRRRRPSRAWRRETPTGFCVCNQGEPVHLTHIKRLKEPEEAWHDISRRLRNLGDKLKVVLWQLPPGFGKDKDRLAAFLDLLDQYPVKNALELRNESWLNDEVVALCRKHGVALCMADWPEFLNELPSTADFIYIRRHGHSGDYTCRYAPEELCRDAGRIRTYLAEGRDVFIYFNNDIGGYAPQNAVELRDML